MGLLQKANPILSVRLEENEANTSSDGDGGRYPFNQDFEAFLRTIGVFPWVFACAWANSITAASVDWVVCRRTRSGGKIVLEKLDSHPLYNLIDRPNPKKTLRQLIWAMGFQMELTGEAFLAAEGMDTVRDGERALMDVSELWLMPSKKVTIVPGATNSDPVGGYNYVGPVTTAHLPPHRVVQAAYPNPFSEDPFHGLSKLKGLESTLMIQARVRGWTDEFFRNAARIPGTLTIPHELSDDKFERLRRQLLRHRHGGTRAAEHLILEGKDTKYTASAATPKDSEFISLWKELLQETVAVMGSPPAIIGLLESSGSFANVKEQRRQHWTGTAIPMLNVIRDALNLSSVVREHGADIRLLPDLSGVEALQKDRLTQAQVDKIHTDVGALSPEEIAEREGYRPPEVREPPVQPPPAPPDPAEPAEGDEGMPEEVQESEPDDRGEAEKRVDLALVGALADSRCPLQGDAFLDWADREGFGSEFVCSPAGIMVRTVPVSLSAKAFDAVHHPMGRMFRHPDGPLLVFGVLTESPLEALKVSEPPEVKDRRGLEWKGRLRLHGTMERRQRALWARLFDEDAKRVAAVIARHKAASLSLGPILNGSSKQLGDDLPEILARAVSTADEWAEPVFLLSRETYEAGFRAEVNTLPAEVGPISLLDDQVAAAVKLRNSVAITSVKATEQAAVRAIVTEGLANGLTTDQIASDLAASFRGMKRWKAAQIARTETTPLINAGMQQAMVQAGVEGKEWLSAKLPTSRSDHIAADGQIVPIGANFVVGDGSGPYPGQLGSAAQDINCVCFVRHVLTIPAVVEV